MGFLDRARKMAEQAQVKLDEAQQQFNQRTGTEKPGSAPVEYDQHGRPVPAAGGPPAASPPPVADPGAPSPPPAAATPAAPPPPPPDEVTPVSAAGDERSETPSARDDRDEYAPPKLSGGDPLAS
jgi:hypothetical protein